MLAGPGEIVEVGDLAVGLFAGDHHDSSAAVLDERSVVGRLSAAGVSGAQDRRPKGLWGLYGNQRRPRWCVNDDLVVIHPLDRVGYRDSRNGRVRTLGDGLDHRCEQLRRSEGADGIMHADDRRVSWNRGKTGAHRLTACRPTGHATLGSHVGRRDDDYYAIADRPGHLGSMVDDAPRADLLVLLGPAEARPGAPSDHDGPDILCCVERHDRRG